MEKKKIKVKSNQIFDNHMDSFEEEYECEIEKFENGFKIVYDGSMIIVEDEVVTINNNNTNLIIEKAINNSSKYETPYGVIDIEVEGKELELNVDSNHLLVSYYIKIGNSEKYINELNIIIMEQ